MENHGKSWKNHGKIHGNIMENHGKSWKHHGNIMENHGKSWKHHGTIMETSWKHHGKSWKHHGKSWKIMETSWKNHGESWKIMEKSWKNHGNIMENHGKSWKHHGNIMENHWKIMETSWNNHGNIMETSWKIMETSWKIMENHGNIMEKSWRIMEQSWKHHGKSWKQHGKIMENHGNSWKIMETHPFIDDYRILSHWKLGFSIAMLNYQRATGLIITPYNRLVLAMPVKSHQFFHHFSPVFPTSSSVSPPFWPIFPAKIHETSPGLTGVAVGAPGDAGGWWQDGAHLGRCGGAALPRHRQSDEGDGGGSTGGGECRGRHGSWWMWCG